MASDTMMRKLTDQTYVCCYYELLMKRCWSNANDVVSMLTAAHALQILRRMYIVCYL